MRLSVLMILSLLVSGISKAQNSEKRTESSNTLYEEVYHLDSLLFDAFNKRDTTVFNNMFSRDLEFYHDKGGLSGYDQTVNFLRETIKADNNLRRELVKGSFEVYAIPGYGAMEIGAHKFCHDENGKQDCGIFKFVHIWKKQNDQWKITRVISYDHK